MTLTTTKVVTSASGSGVAEFTVIVPLKPQERHKFPEKKNARKAPITFLLVFFTRSPFLIWKSVSAFEHVQTHLTK